MIVNRRTLLAIAVTASLAAAGCATTPAPAPIADTVGRTANLQTLSQMLVRAGLTDTLRAAGPYTLFAPSDEAFKALPAKTQAELSANPERLKAVLAYHVTAGRLAGDQVKNGNVKTLQGANLALARSGSFVTVESAVAAPGEIAATNGVIHVIDQVLMPPK